MAGAGFSVAGEAAVEATGEGLDWSDGGVWKQSANNTKWCLIGCSIGEFGTLAYYQWAGWPLEVAVGTALFWFLVILPLINGLATSVMLETVLLMRGQMDFGNALQTAFNINGSRVSLRFGWSGSVKLRRSASISVISASLQSVTCGIVSQAMLIALEIDFLACDIGWRITIPYSSDS